MFLQNGSIRLGLLVLAFLCFCASPVAAERTKVSDPERQQTLERVKSLLMLHDSYRAIEHMAGLGEPHQVARRYVDLVDDLYWKEKNLALAIVMGRAGIQEILTAAGKVESREPGEAARLRGIVKQLAYNLASYSWPGWDEPGIIIKPDYLLMGYDAARLNLRLALELEKSALRISTAYWMLGAQLLALKRHEEAITVFALALDKAKEAKEPAYQHLAIGFIGICEVAAASDFESGRRKILESQRILRDMPGREGPQFAEQLVAAVRVFLGSVPDDAAGN